MLRKEIKYLQMDLLISGIQAILVVCIFVYLMLNGINIIWNKKRDNLSRISSKIRR